LKAKLQEVKLKTPKALIKKYNSDFKDQIVSKISRDSSLASIKSSKSSKSIKSNNTKTIIKTPVNKKSVKNSRESSFTSNKS